jgi:hypothetical protein
LWTPFLTSFVCLESYTMTNSHRFKLA